MDEEKNDIMKIVSCLLLGTRKDIEEVLGPYVDDFKEYSIPSMEEDLLSYNVKRCLFCGLWFMPKNIILNDGEECGECEDYKNEQKDYIKSVLEFRIRDTMFL